MIELLTLKEQKCLGPMTFEAELRKEERIAGGNDAFDSKKSCIAVVGVQSPTLPGVVPCLLYTSDAADE